MKKFEKPAGFLLLALGVMVSNVSQAELIKLKPGEERDVGNGDSIHDYDLESSSLTIKGGGQTGRIVANSGAKLQIDRGTVTAAGQSAITLNNSQTVISKGTIIATLDPANPNAQAYGIWLGGLVQPSSAVVVNSFVSGVERGINVQDGSRLELIGTEVEGHAGMPGGDASRGGVGIAVTGSKAFLSQNSKVTGEQHGVVLTATNREKASLDVDQSTVLGRNGSAIVVSATAPRGETAEINVRNGSTLTGGNGIILEVEKRANARLNVSNSQLVGDVLGHEGSSTHLDLNSNASLTGTITNATSLVLDDSSRWIMHGDSTVGALKLDGGLVDLRGTDGNASFHRLDLKELSGSGTFALGTDLAANTGDFLNVSEKATGNHKLHVQNTGAEPTANGPDRQLVHIENGDAQFAVDSADGLVDAGAYAYELEQRASGANGKDWFLVQTGTLSKSTEMVMGLFSAAPTVWYGESANLRSRMGELRTDGNQGGGWIRTYGNKHNISANSGLAYSQKQHGISFGADMPISNHNGQWLVGLMGGYSQSNLDLKSGSNGKVDSFYLGAYSTWLAEDGFYVDALVKANRFQNSADVTMRDGGKSKGDYSNYGLGASLEAGKHFTFNDGWFVEPFAQVSALWVSGEDYRLDNGLRASSNKADSFLGKVGSQVGRKFALHDGGFVQPYVKAAVAREFITSNSVKVNDTRFTNDLSGTRAELGLGLAAQLTDVLQVHTDFDYMNGKNIEQPWGLNVGVRYNW